MTAKRRYEFVVVGGGLVGAAIAWGLARARHEVAMIDEGDVAYRASRGNFGLVWVQSKGMGLAAYGGWTLRSSQLWPALAAALLAETGVDVRLDQPGGFIPFLSETEREHRVAQMVRLHAQAGFPDTPWEVVDAAELRRRVPGIGPTVLGATFCPLDGHANPLKLLRALHRGFALHGGAYLPLAPVSGVRREGEGFLLDTAGGTIAAGRVVLASGLGNATLAPQVGLHAPVRPQRGQVIVTERVRPLLRQPLVTLRQTDEGTLMIGDSQEEAGFAERTTQPVLSVMAERAVKLFPALADVRITRTWAALRVMSPDGFPIYQQSSQTPGAFLATCHSGVTLAAAHAFDLAPQVAAGRLGDAMRPFAAGRFPETPDVSSPH